MLDKQRIIDRVCLSIAKQKNIEIAYMAPEQIRDILSSTQVRAVIDVLVDAINEELTQGEE